MLTMIPKKENFSITPMHKPSRNVTSYKCGRKLCGDYFKIKHQSLYDPISAKDIDLYPSALVMISEAELRKD